MAISRSIADYFASHGPAKPSDRRVDVPPGSLDCRSAGAQITPGRCTVCDRRRARAGRRLSLTQRRRMHGALVAVQFAALIGV
jgi:hypothetical protein